MNRPLPSLDALHVFEAAARLGSFKAAAAELSITATAVSHRIRALEDALGCPLFVRRVRAVSLSPEGQTLQATVSHSLHAIRDTVDQIRRPLRHSITVSVTPEFATQWLVPRLADFQRQCPDIDLHVHATYAPVDLNAGNADLAVRYGHGSWPKVHSEALFQELFAPVSSPMLKRRLASDPRRWPLIHMDWHLPSHEALDWSAWASAAGIEASSLQSGIRYSNANHAVQAALAGQGVALLGLPLLAEELRHELLVVLDGPRLPGQFYHVCTPTRRTTPPALDRVRQWLLDQAAQSRTSERRGPRAR